MEKMLANQAVKDDLEDIKRGLHVAMEQLINRQDYREAEEVLRQVDIRLVALINALQTDR